MSSEAAAGGWESSCACACVSEGALVRAVAKPSQATFFSFSHVAHRSAASRDSILFLHVSHAVLRRWKTTVKTSALFLLPALQYRVRVHRHLKAAVCV